MNIFSGSAHETLSAEVVKILGVDLAQSEVLRFGNSEVKVTIKQSVRDTDCFVIQPLSNPTDTHIIELCFFADALAREGARSVTAVIPYFGYAKQNLQHRPGECVSVNVVIRMLETVGIDRVISFDLHDEATAGVFNIPFTPLTAFSLLAERTKAFFTQKNIPDTDIAIVSPDQGAAERVRKYGEYFFGHTDFHEAVIEKKRDQIIPHKAEPVELYGNVSGKIALIVDDMIVSGSTVAPAVDMCLQKGATAVYAAVVHHDFTSDAPEILNNSNLIRLFTTNTIPLRPDQKFEKMEEISVASMIAEEIRSLVN